MRRIGLFLLLILLANPGWAQSARFPMKQVFVATELNGKDVRGRGLTFLVDSTATPKASGFGGCNTWTASPEFVEPDRFRLRDMGTTKKMCTEGNVMQIEDEFVSTLARIARWRVASLALMLSGDQASVYLLPHGPR